MRERYDQHVCDSARLDREPMMFEPWAVQLTWEQFCRLAGLCAALSDTPAWETRGSILELGGTGYGSTVLCRRLLDGVVLVAAVLAGVRKKSRKAHAAVTAHLAKRMTLEQRPALTEGKRLIYDWLCAAAERDLTRAI